MKFVVDPVYTASFDVNAQNTFTPVCPDELPVSGGTEIVPELNRQATFARLRIGSKDAHSPSAVWVASDCQPAMTVIEGGVEADLAWPLHAVPGTKGFDLIDGLPPVTSYDYFVWKGVEGNLHPYGACYHDLSGKLSTGVIEYLRDQKIDTVLVGGLATDYCVKTTALQLRKAGFAVCMNVAATRGVDPVSTERALMDLRKAGIVLIDSCDDLTRYAA